MSISTKQLRYKMEAVESSISLYDAPADVGSDRLVISDGITSLYAALGAPSNSLASRIRVQKNDVTWAVLFSVPEDNLMELLQYSETEDCQVAVSVNNVALGSVSLSTISVPYGRSISITATPASGKTLSNWSISSMSGNTTSTTNPLVITITSDTFITANFA